MTETKIKEKGAYFTGWAVYDPVSGESPIKRHCCLYRCLGIAALYLVPKDPLEKAMVICRLISASVYRDRIYADSAISLSDKRELTQEEADIILEIRDRINQ